MADTKPYYLNIYDENPDNSATTASSQANFAIAYGHKDGNGIWNNSESTYKFKYPTRSIYSQYQGLLIGYTDPYFTFEGGADSSDILVINVNRARIKEKLDPGNFEVTFAQLSGSLGTAFSNSGHTGSNVQKSGTGAYIQVIDDSSVTSGGSVDEGGLVYNLVSGKLEILKK